MGYVSDCGQSRQKEGGSGQSTRVVIHSIVVAVVVPELVIVYDHTTVSDSVDRNLERVSGVQGGELSGIEKGSRSAVRAIRWHARREQWKMVVSVKATTAADRCEKDDDESGSLTWLSLVEG